jgi:hypothetical protein
MRSVFQLVFGLLLISSGAGAQSFSNYVVGPYTGCCNGTFGGSPLPTDFIAINRVQPGNTNITASLPLSAFASAADIQAANGRINQAFQQLQQLQQIQQAQQASVNQLFSGVAAAVAINSAPMPSAPGRTTWSVNAAAFQSEVGGGFSLAYRLSTSMPIAITASYGSGGASANVGRVGLMGEF